MAESDGRYMFNFSKNLLNCFPKALSILYDHWQCLRVSGPPWPGQLAPEKNALKAMNWTHSKAYLIHFLPIGCHYSFLPGVQSLESHCFTHFVQFSNASGGG